MKYIALSFFISFSIHAKTQVATFAGGCFWCIESAFDDQPGVISAISGYSDGSKDKAKYKLVSSGKTRHYEAVQVSFDDTKTTYKAMLEIFWRSINPTDPDGQFADRGPHYKTAIFFHNKEQKELALKSSKLLQESKIFRRPIIVPILPHKSFYKAEEYHQDYHKKNSKRYKAYYYGSGRGTYLKDLWSRHKNFKIFK